MESTDYNEVMKLVDRYAGFLTDDPVDGLKKITDELGINTTLLRGMLSIISLHYKEHAAFLLSYMAVGLELKQRQDHKYLEHLQAFAPFRNLVISQLDFMSMALFHGKLGTVETVINEIVDQLYKLAHDRLVSTTLAVNHDHAILQVIESLQKSLNRLSDFVTIADEHKTLKEMAVLQKKFAALATGVQDYV